jgi:hypothetical protein
MPRLTESRYEETFLGSAYTAEEVDFFMAMDRYKREHDRPFPTLHEVLRVLKGLGYRKLGAPARRIRRIPRRVSTRGRVAGRWGDGVRRQRRTVTLSPRHPRTPSSHRTN